MYSILLLNGCDKTDSPTTQQPILVKPDSPINIIASIKNNKTQLSWDAPVIASTVTTGATTTTTNEVSYYQVERTILNQNKFTSIGTQLPTTQLTFTDLMTSRKYGDSFEYRVIAGNSKGKSASILSLPVTPGSSLNISHIAPNYLTSSYAKDKASFGFELAFSADGMTAAVATKGRSFINGQKPSASVEIFKRGVANDWSAFSVAVIPKPSLATFALSPDGKTLALSDQNPKSGVTIGAGSVEIFTQDSSGQWDLIQTTTLVSPTPGKLYLFGSALTFSTDSKTLAVAETGTGIVRVYSTVVGTGWGTQPSSILNVPTSTKLELVSPSIAFSPDGQTLAIGDTTNTANTALYAGTVQLFSKNTDGSWNTNASTVFNSEQTGTNFFFGQSIAFSTDGNSIAVSEVTSQVLLDNTTTYRGGNVQLFTKDSSNMWKTVPDNTFVSSASLRTRFGKKFSFNSTGTMLAISEGKALIFIDGTLSEKAGAVLVYKKDSVGVWIERPAAVLGSLSPSNLGVFGDSVVFNPGDDTLFVGDPSGLTNTGMILDTGYINIYDSRLFK